MAYDRVKPTTFQQKCKAETGVLQQSDKLGQLQHLGPMTFEWAVLLLAGNQNYETLLHIS